MPRKASTLRAQAGETPRSVQSSVIAPTESENIAAQLRLKNIQTVGVCRQLRDRKNLITRNRDAS